MLQINRLIRRLLPLYCAAFLQGFVLWYAFEKIFLKGIGFTDATIGFMIAAYSLVMLLAETPSGVLADRWSRKGVLIIAGLTLALASLIGGLSQNVPTYICANLLWGVYFALYSGTYDSIVYDTIYEETGNSTRFDRYFGWVRIVDSAALVISSLAAVLVVNALDLRASYFVTVPFAIASAVVLLKFTEPKLHKKKAAISIRRQVKETYKAVAKNKQVFLVVNSLVCLSVVVYITLEFSQLWYIALAAPLALYGMANAVLLSSLGLGGFLASRLRLYRFPLVVASLCIAFCASLALVVVRNVYVVAISLTVLTTIMIGLSVVFTRVLHDSLESNIRAGASSAVGTISRMLIIPIALLIGYLSNRFSIFNAAWIVVGMVLILSCFVYTEASKDNRKALEPR